jgi:hypothetical protein
MTKGEALARLAESRQAMEKAIGALSKDQMTGAKVEGDWTPRDIIGHIAAWDKAVLIPLREYAAGKGFRTETITDIDGWNNEQAAMRRSLPLDVPLNEFRAVREEMVAVAERLPDEQWIRPIPYPWGDQGPLAEALHGLAYHEAEHATTIVRWHTS